LLAVGDIQVVDPEFGMRFRERFGNAAQGSPIALRVRRMGQTLTLNARLRFAPGALRIIPVDNPTPRARRVRDGILQGKVDR
jgi:hypothetical protein